MSYGAADTGAAVVADALAQYERDIAAARKSAFALGLVLLDAQATRRMSPTYGRQVLAAVTASQGGLDMALQHADAAHRLTAKIADGLGIDPSMYGEQKDPKESEERRFLTGSDQSVPATA